MLTKVLSGFFVFLVSIIVFLKIAEADEMHSHGYIGTPQFDIKEDRFSLFNKEGTCKYIFNDFHYHPRDFLMKGEALSDIYKETQENCVDKVLINSLPFLEYWSEDARVRPVYYTDDKSKLVWNTISDIPTFEEYRKLPAVEKEKFVFLVNGFLHFDRGAIEAVKTTLALYPDIPIVGFGEIFGEHDIMTDQLDQPAYIDTKALDPIYELAGQKEWFVMLHHNLSHRSFKKPTDAFYRSDLDNVLTRHKNTLFVLAHAGISRNIVISDLTVVMDDLLGKNKNLYIDISFVVYEDYIIAGGTIDPDWVKLIEKYPDKFLYGSDNLMGYGEFFNVKKYIPLLDALKPETAKKVAHDNFEFLVDRALAKK